MKAKDVDVGMVFRSGPYAGYKVTRRAATGGIPGIGYVVLFSLELELEDGWTKNAGTGFLMSEDEVEAL